MRTFFSPCTWILASLIIFCSSLIFFINELIYHYPGNNYFPNQIIPFALVLIFINVGLKLFFKPQQKAYLIGEELLALFTIMLLIMLATNAVQLTPFFPIDIHIIHWEKNFHFYWEEKLIEWTNQQPMIKDLFITAYNSLPYQMSIIPVIIILVRRFILLHEYFFHLLFTTFVGFSFYYFFPTTAPASHLPVTLFLPEQIATGLKFHQIHEHLIPKTNEGGLIALPSFHVTWALLCVNLLKPWPFFYWALALFNLFLILSCVLLGWHYILDILGAFLLLFISFKAYKKCHR